MKNTKEQKISKLKHLEGIKPGFFNKFMRTLKKAALTSFAAYLFVMPAVNLVREIHEENLGDNKIVDVDLGFGSIVLKNTDERTAIQVYDDVLNAALNTEGLANVYDETYVWTETAKKDLIKKVVDAMAKEAGIRIDNIVYKDLSGQNVGMYVGFNFGDFSWSANTMYIDSNYLNTAPFKEVIATTVHEVGGHGTENINVLTNENTNNVFNTTDLQYISQIAKRYNKDLYYTAPAEIVAHTIEMAFNLKANEKFVSNDIRSERAIYEDKLYPLLNEVIFNEEDDIRLTTNYEQITLQELIFNGIQKLFSEKNLPSDKESVEQSYLYQVLEYGYGNYLRLTYSDFVNGNSSYLRADLSQELEQLKTNVAYYQNGSYEKLISRDVDYRELSQSELQIMAMRNLAKEMSTILRIMNYNQERYDENLMKETHQLIKDNLGLFDEKTLSEYYLDDFIPQTTQTQQAEFGN